MGLAKKEAALLLMLSALFAGCATVDQKVSLLYRPVPAASGGSGVLHLSATGAEAGACRPAGVQWVVGQVKDSTGSQTGDILSRTPPEDMLLEAFRAELAAAGYQVVHVPSLTQAVGKGVDFTRIVVDLEQVRGVFKAEAKSALEVSLELWKNGSRFKRLQYRYALSDAAVSGKDLLTGRVLEESFRQMMKQAVPEIVTALEKGA